MKTIQLLSVGVIVGVLFAGSAFAAKVGDTAVFVGTMSNAAASYPIGLTIKIASLASSGKFNVETSITVQGQAQSSTAERTADQVGDEAKAAEVVEKCATAGGVAEPVTLGSGEVLPACKVSSLRNGVLTTNYIAAVPFLNAKLVQVQNGITTSLTLQSYVRGQ